MGAIIGEILPLAGTSATGEVVVAIAVFTVIAAATVAVPVIAHLLDSDRMAAPLEALGVAPA